MSIVYIRFHFRCCIFHEFEQMYTWLWYHIEQFYCLNKPSVLTNHMFIPTPPKPCSAQPRHWHFCHSSKASTSFPSQRLCICSFLFSNDLTPGFRLLYMFLKYFSVIVLDISFKSLFTTSWKVSLIKQSKCPWIIFYPFILYPYSF